MIRKLIETLDRNKKTVEDKQHLLSLTLQSDMHLIPRKIDAITNQTANKLSSIRQEIANIPLSKEEATIKLFLSNFNGLIKSIKPRKLHTDNFTISKKEQKDITKDDTNAFLRIKDKSNDRMTDILKKIDKNLDIKATGSSSSDNKRDDVDNKKDNSSFLGTIGKVGAGAALFTGAKKFAPKIMTKIAPALKIMGIVGKAGLKFGKKIIPFAGIAFALWDLVSTVKTGYSDYKKFDAAGDEKSKSSVIKYTMFGIVGDLLGVVGSLASSTGIGLPVALAIDAISLGISMWAGSMRDDTMTEAVQTSATGASPMSNTTSLLLRENKDEWEYNDGNKWLPLIDATTDKPISLASNTITKSDSNYQLNTVNGAVDLVYDGSGPKMRTKDGKVVPVNTGYVNGESKTVNVQVQKNILVGNDNIKLPKSNKVMKKLAVSSDKNLIVDVVQPDDKWYQNIIPKIEDLFFNSSSNGSAGDGSIIGTDIAGMGAGYLDVKGADGKIIRRTGNRNWRNNNPGNINYGPFAKAYGAIAKDDAGFAIFGTVEQGRKAQYDLLFKENSTRQHYSNLDVYSALAIYNPVGDKRLGGGNDPVSYAKQILKAVGGVNKPLGQYSESERQIILATMEKREGYKEGRIGNVPGYETGTNKIEKTGPALIHKGEMIIPARNASKIRSSMDSRQMTSVDIDDEISEDFWINTFMKELANVVKAEYLGAQ